MSTPSFNETDSSTISWQGTVLRADSAMTHRTHTSTGAEVNGVPVPSILRSDPFVTGLMLVCFLLFVGTLKNNRKYILLHMKHLFQQKERASSFDIEPEINHGFVFVLCTITCVLSGICLYGYFLSTETILFLRVPSLLVLSIYIACSLVYLPIKRRAYSIVNWIFFHKDRNETWINTYFCLISSISFLLFPILLLIIYQNINPQTSLYLILSVLIIAKILLLYRCFKNFFNHIYGILHFIAYLCALEVIPLILFWKVINYINNILILNY